MTNPLDFVSPERAETLARRQPVVFAELLGESAGARRLEVRVMRPVAGGVYEVERNDTGPVAGETVYAIVAQIAAEHRCRYATIYSSEDRSAPLA